MSEKQPSWEEVCNTDWCSTVRLRVPGGWLYRVMAEMPDDRVEMEVVFVPEVRMERWIGHRPNSSMARNADDES